MFKNTIAAVLLLLLFQTSIAQKKDSLKVTNLDEVVVTAQYVPQSEKNAVYKIKVLNAETINNKAANNLRELLQQELNLNLSQNSVFGTSIDIQGISKENIKILIDGVPVIGRLNGIIDLNQVNLNTIEKVEIIEGPTSVFYGTDAMGGIINLITKKQQQSEVEGSISTYYENINALNVTGDVGFKLNENTFRFNTGYYNFNGISTNDAPRNLNWEERKQFFSDFMYNRKLNKLNLRYNARISNEELFSIGEPDRRGNIEDINYYTKRFDNSLNLQGTAFNNKYIEILLAYNNYQRYHDTFNVDLDANTYKLSNLDSRDENIVKYNFGNFKAQIGSNNKESNLNYAIGTDMVIEISEGGRILNGKQDIETIALFGSVNYKITEAFEIQPGARYTYNSSYGNLFSPALNAKFQINQNNTVRFSYARGFRAPSLKELFLDFNISAGPVTFIISGNEDLDVEKSHSFNLQYSYSTNSKKYGYFSVEPSLFYNNISNLISLSEIVNFKRNYININKFKSLGGKIDFSYNPFETLTLNAGFSIIGRYNEFNEDYNTEEFLYTPEITSSINYLFKKSQLNFNIFYKYSGERTGFYLDQDTNELVKTTRDDFNNLDANISKSFFNNTLKTSIGIKNIFNVKDIDTTNEVGQAHSQDIQLWGRSFFVQTNFYF